MGISKSIGRRTTAKIALAAVCLLSGSAAVAQTPAKPGQQQQPVLSREDQLAVDSAKLLQLATELKAAVDKSTKDQLSITVIKKADEVEKLARKVREEMKITPANEQ